MKSTLGGTAFLELTNGLAIKIDTVSLAGTLCEG
jgi:hypothetical protein